MRDRYAVWENETTHTFYIEALPNTVQPGKRFLYSGKEYLNFKNKDHAEMLVNMLNGLVDEAGILEQRVHYWKIEAETDHGRWLRCLEDIERLRAEIKELNQRWPNYHVDALIKAEAEIERLRASSFVTAVPVEEYEKLKAEVERLRKAGDAVSLCLEAFWKGKPYDTSTNIECFDAWNAAKEGKQS